VRRAAVLAAAVSVALAAAATAAADRPTVRLTPAGQAAARAVILRRGDFGPAPGWSGVSTKPDLASSFPCTTYHPKQSDLVVTGGAANKWKNGLLEVDNEVEVLRTAAMVRLDWQRTVAAPQVVPCLRASLAKDMGASAHLDSFGRIAFPQVATLSRAFRAVMSVTSGGTTIRVLVDVVVVGRGRTEINLTTIAPLASKAQVEATELRLARLLVARAK
jgi:hypothetical protein